MIVLAFGVLCIQTAFAYTKDCSGWRLESQYTADWSDARSHCRYLDGELWRPVSGIWYCASSLIRRIDDGYIWTGAYRYSEKHSWRWTDGSIVYGEHWMEGEPNDAGNEDCVTASYRGWNDEHCNDRFRFVCQWPICGGRTNRNGACNEREYDKIIFRSGNTRSSGDGTCTSPGTCKYCKDGFFANGGYCSICPKIDNCNHRRCTGYYDNHCVYCEGSVKPKKHWEAYTLSSDNRKCNKACSWRSDSTRCYPGSYDGQLASKCKCTRGFFGSQCDEITEYVKIMHAEAKLSDDSNTILKTPDDPNVPYNQPVKWSNNNKWNFLELDFSLKYHTFERPPAPDPTGDKHFVTDFKYEVIKALLVIDHRRKGVSRNNRMLNCRNGYSYPIFHITNCGKKKKFDIQSWGFQHADKLTITCTAENGGFLKYRDREDGNRDIKVRLKGKTVQSSLIFRWDYIKPYQECVNGSKTNCYQPPVDCKDVSKQPDIKVGWGGWKDDLSGIDHFELELYELVSTGRHLNHINGPAVHRDENISVHSIEQVLKLPKPGMYSMILTSIDKAGNQQSARCLVFYDDISVVDIKHTKRIKVNEASAKTNFTWVSVDDMELSVTWTDRFLNERHEKHGWLYGVAAYVGVQEEYDDLFGPRNVSSIENIHGIVKFEIKYEIYGPYLKANQSLTQTANELNQTEYLNITWEDGFRLDITIRAFDILNEYKDDMISVYRDVSSPVIQNLWLTKGDIVNKSVYSMEDFSKMTIEWDAFDYDSGLNIVEWRIYNNYTTLLEQATTVTQRQEGKVNDCIKKYDSRGSSCYCTMFHGCYHKHFQIRPDIVKDSGITHWKEMGLHDSDFYIEVTATNKALLKTKNSIQISIDLSPPHAGYVHDGIKGDQEVDFQQDAQLYAYWEEFLDEESGIDFYQYIFSNKCFNETEMALSNEKQFTNNTSACFNASSEGIYFISVIAVNKAAESSMVVCSDGVTVTTTIPFIKDFVFKNLKARNQILKDHNDTLWLLDSTLIRHKITDLSGLSGYFLEMAHTNVSFEVFPEGGPVDKIDAVLQDTKSKRGILGVLPKNLSFQIEWKSGVKESLIRDYAIGISASLEGMAPDIYSFQSTNHDKKFKIVHDNLEVIGNFYVIVKTTSQSGVIGNQSIGPFMVDESPPMFKNNAIKVCNINGYLFTSWQNDTVFDKEDPFPLQYEFAVGSTAYRQDVQTFTRINSVGPCTAAYPPICSAILILDLQLPLHVNHDYYISLRVTNVLGMASTKTAEPFRYIQLPTKGVIFDVPPDVLENKEVKDILDVDFTCNRKTLGVVWSGFEHPHFNVNFHVCIGSKKGHCDIDTGVALNSSNSFHVFKDLNLKDFQTYFITVKAEVASSTVLASSDGITLLDITHLLSGIVVFDGTNCTDVQNSFTDQHIFETQLKCVEDNAFQTSTTYVAANWIIPNDYVNFTQQSFIAIEERVNVGELWRIFRNYTYVGKHDSFTIGDLNLQPGRFYRSSIRFCANDNCCFPDVKSDGFVVLHNNPKTGGMEVVHKHILSESDQVLITLERMYDPDVEDEEEAVGMIDYYEWALGNDIGIVTKWIRVESFLFSNVTHLSFQVLLNGSLDFSKCQRFHVRGYNKADMWSVVSSDIKNCHVIDSNSFIIPNIVVDAVGKQEKGIDGMVHEGFGKDIVLELNVTWNASDVDYTPYRNVLSAVWPNLRHRNYTWAVFKIINSSSDTMHFKDDVLQLNDPCLSPNAIKCGTTCDRFVNVRFSKRKLLKHGERYMICISAPQTVVNHEEWNETLDEISDCSDGVTVDLTPPTVGHVWIGTGSSNNYQTSTSDIRVNWEVFNDVEQAAETRHTSAIRSYHLGIGSTIGGSDIFPFTDIGIANHYTLHNLRLQNGHEYFASIKAYDFTGKSTTATSAPVIIDNTPPERTLSKIQITERHINKFTELNACWKGAFLDKESGIDHYMWGVGSRKGHDDIITFTKTEQDCEVSTQHNDYDTLEGHSYFITVKAINRANLINSASSSSYKVDQSAPIDGYVYDGCRQTAIGFINDVDYQVNERTLFSCWEGFSEPHSAIQMYYIMIGTCPRCQDVLNQMPVGSIHDYTLHNIHLTSGLKYFTTVTACNTADLCTSVTSDGVLFDDSPPNVGVVKDGMEKDDTNYQSSRNYIAFEWYGFTDTQSGLDKVFWKAGTKLSSDDIVPLTELSITNPIVNMNLTTDIPLKRRIFVTVRVYNKAGLFSEASSNGFIVDETPPIFVQKLLAVHDHWLIDKDLVVFKSIIEVKWKVEDKESFIDYQNISVNYHMGEQLNSLSFKLNGIAREYTFPRLDLHEGVKYAVHLIACNRAKLCTESKSDPILVDRSALIPG